MKITLPNGTVGKPYRVEVDKSLKIDAGPDIGLELDQEGRFLIGIPNLAGTFIFKCTAEGKSGELTLLINPDPRSLWKDLPSNQSDPFWRPDSASLFTLSPGGQMTVGASLRGRSHAHEGLFRDDDFRAGVLDNGWAILIGGDGAGSAKFSRRGSELAVITAFGVIEEHLKSAPLSLIELGVVNGGESALTEFFSELLTNAVSRARKTVAAEAAKIGAEERDFATTLLILLYRSFGSKALAVTFSVGDGAIALFSEDGKVELLNKEDTGQYAGQTQFLYGIGSNIKERIMISITDPISIGLLMTDGVSDPKFGTAKDLSDPAKWRSLVTELAPVLSSDNPNIELLNWLNFWSQGSHDDRTLIMILPNGSDN